jgi:hypothetical protein
MDVPQIARVTFTSEDRVRDVIHNFNADGFDALYPRLCGCAPGARLGLTSSPTTPSAETRERDCQCRWVGGTASASSAVSDWLTSRHWIGCRGDELGAQASRLAQQKIAAQPVAASRASTRSAHAWL